MRSKNGADELKVEWRIDEKRREEEEENEVWMKRPRQTSQLPAGGRRDSAKCRRAGDMMEEEDGRCLGVEERLRRS